MHLVVCRIFYKLYSVVIKARKFPRIILIILNISKQILHSMENIVVTPVIYIFNIFYADK